MANTKPLSDHPALDAKGSEADSKVLAPAEDTAVNADNSRVMPKFEHKVEQNTASTQTPSLPSDAGFTWGGYFQSIGVLLLLLAFLWFAMWLLRKYGRFNFIPKLGAFPSDGLRLEAQLPLGPRKGLAVVRFLDKRILLGITEQQITLLQEIKDNDDGMDFKKIMEQSQDQQPPS